jgi:hypothetical protein
MLNKYQMALCWCGFKNFIYCFHDEESLLYKYYDENGDVFYPEITFVKIENELKNAGIVE